MLFLCKSPRKSKGSGLMSANTGMTAKPILKGETSPHQIRWRNTAEWARNHMVNQAGLMKKGSKRGSWEISTKGRKWLQDGNK